MNEIKLKQTFLENYIRKSIIIVYGLLIIFLNICLELWFHTPCFSKLGNTAWILKV